MTARNASQRTRNETSSLWDTVTVAEQDGFLMPVVPPLHPLPQPSLHTSVGSPRLRDRSLNLWDAEDSRRDTGSYWDSQEHSGDSRRELPSTQSVVSQGKEYVRKAKI